MSFGDVASASIRFARAGFPADPRLCETIVQNEVNYRRFAENARIMMPGGKPPLPGQMFRQTDLAASMQYMADEVRPHVRFRRQRRAEHDQQRRKRRQTEQDGQAKGEGPASGRRRRTGGARRRACWGRWWAWSGR